MVSIKRVMFGIRTPKEGKINQVISMILVLSVSNISLVNVHVFTRNNPFYRILCVKSSFY